MSARPVFVVIEGLDGVGKSSVAEALARRLGAERLSTPGDVFADVRGAADRAVEGHPLARTLFYAATVALASDRAEAVLATGVSVVLDRYWLTTLAYARADGEGGFFAEIERRLAHPDVTVYLHAPLSVRRGRLLARGHATGDDRRTLDVDADRRLDLAYRSLEARAIAGRFVAIDATSDDVAALAARIEAEVRR